MFGKEIKRARQIANFTQDEVSKGTGLPQSTISWIEADKGIANIYQCFLLADFFEITIDELIGRNYQSTGKNINISDSFNNSNNSGNFNF